MLSSILLQEVATITQLEHIVELILKIIAVAAVLWGLYEAFYKKVNKDDLTKELKKKVDVTEFESYKEKVQSEFNFLSEEVDEAKEISKEAVKQVREDVLWLRGEFVKLIEKKGK